MSIRAATLEDLVSIQNLNQQIFDVEIEASQPRGWDISWAVQAEGGKKYFIQAINNEENFSAFVYEYQGQISAYMILKIIPLSETSHRKNVKLAQLHTFCVDKPSRRAGVGQEMLLFAKEWATEKGCNQLKVVAIAGNQPARNFYLKNGFKEFEITYEMELDT